MLGNTGIKLVARQIIFAAQQSKRGFFDEQMQVARHFANAAIALTQYRFRRRIKFKSNFAAMATPVMDDRFAHKLSYPFAIR